MKVFIAMFLISGFCGLSTAHAVGRDDDKKSVDCSKVIQELRKQMKVPGAGGDDATAAPEADSTVRPAN